MKCLKITSVLLSMLMLCSCAGITERSELPETSESSKPIESAELTDASRTSPVSAEEQNQNVQDEQPDIQPETEESGTDEAADTPLPERDFSEFFALSETPDYSGRYCGWKFDSSAVLSSEEEFLLNGGSEDMLTAAEAAVRATEEFRQIDQQTAEMELYPDGRYYYIQNKGGEDEYLTCRFTMSFESLDENGRALPLLTSAAAGDFDGDGKTEAFLLYETPSFSWMNYTESFAVFVSSSGKAEVVSSGIGGRLLPMRYRDFMHMGIEFGVNNESSHAEIFAVENDAAVNKHIGFSLGSQFGVCMLESAAMAPGSWLIIWDNIDKQYKEIAPVPAPEGLAGAVYNSPLLDRLRERMSRDSESEALFESEESMQKNPMQVFGGRYVSIGPFGITLEYRGGNLDFAEECIISYAYDEVPVCQVDLASAEEQAVPAPLPPAPAECGEYSLTTEGVYTTEKEFRQAAGDLLAEAAAEAVCGSRVYKEISYQLENAKRSGFTYTFTKEYDDEGGQTREYTYDEELLSFSADGRLNPAFLTAACADFDNDGGKEAFVVYRLPFMGRYKIDGREYSEQYLAVYVSSDGNALVLPDWTITRNLQYPELRLIKYENEIHIYNADTECIMAVRRGIPVYMGSFTPDGDSRYFNGNWFYNPAMGEYCCEKFYPMSGELLAELTESPQFSAAKLNDLPERAWITAGGYIVAERCAIAFRWDGESFARSGQSGGYWRVIRNNEQFRCYDLPLSF